MGLMSMLFGKGPETVQDSKKEEVKFKEGIGDTTNKVEKSLHINEITDPTIYKDVQDIVDVFWKHINNKENNELVTPLGHNTVYNSNVYELNFQHQGHPCVVTFNDLSGDDSFTAKCDMDGNQGTPDDIYEFKIDYAHDTPESGIAKFTVERGHPSDTGVLHFRAIDEEEAYNAIAFVKQCVIPSDNKIINIAA